MLMQDLLDFFKMVVFPIVAIIIVIFLLVNWHTSYQCKNYAEITGKKTNYVFLDTCYVETDSGMMRYAEYLKRYTAFDSVKGALK